MKKTDHKLNCFAKRFKWLNSNDGYVAKGSINFQKVQM